MAGTSDSGGFQLDGDLTYLFNQAEIFEELVDRVRSEIISNGPSTSHSTLTLQPASASHPFNPPISEETGREKRKAQHTKVKSAQTKRARAPNWSDSEKHALLVLKRETLERPDITESWITIVSNHPDINERCTASCQGQWDTLKKQYESIREHESKILSGCISFWKMKDHEKSDFNETLPENKKLPRVFYKAWYELMESIIRAETIKKTLPRKVTRTPQVLGGNISSSCIQIPSTNTDLANFPSSQGSLPPESEVKLGMPDDDIISTIAPFVNKQIEDALKPILSVLRSRQEDEQKHREKLLSIEEEKLALEREKMQFRRSLLARPMGTGSPFDVEAGVALRVEPIASRGQLANFLPASTEGASEQFTSQLLTHVIHKLLGKDIPTKNHRYMNQMASKIDALLLELINGRLEAVGKGEASSYGNDLLGRMLKAASEGWNEETVDFNLASVPLIHLMID